MQFLYLDDDNRIVLQSISGHPDCQRDYINASYIHVCITIIMYGIRTLNNYFVCYVYLS